MLSPGVTTWGDVVPVLLVAATVLFVPGVVSARLAGLAWFSALGMAPLVSTTILLAGGVVTAMAGRPWGLPALVASTVAVWLVQALALGAGRIRKGQQGRSRLRGGRLPLDRGRTDRPSTEAAGRPEGGGTTASASPVGAGVSVSTKKSSRPKQGSSPRVGASALIRAGNATSLPVIGA